METNYASITQEDFERTVRDYAIYRLVGAAPADDSEGEADDESE